MSTSTSDANSMEVRFSPTSIWFSFLKKHWITYGLGAASVFLCNIMQVLVARNLGWILDFFTGKQIPLILTFDAKKDTFLLLFLILLGGRIFLSVGRWGWRITLAKQTHYSSEMLRRMIWQNVRYFPRKLLDSSFSKGVLMNAANSDVNQARFIFGFTLVAVCDVMFLTVLTIATMLFINVKLTLLSLGVLAFLPFMVRLLSDKEITRYRTAQENLSEFNDLATQAVTSIRLQRLTSTGETWVAKLLRGAKDYRKLRLKAIFTSLFYMPLMGFSSVVSYAVLFIFGFGEVLSGAMSVGDFVAMQGLIFLLQDPLLEIGFIVSDMKKGITSLERLTDIYNGEKEGFLYNAGNNIQEDKTILKVQDLSFSYDGQQNVISNINLELLKGERLGVTGPIGAGKSTLIKILAGVERNIEGQLSFMGKEFDTFSNKFIREYIGHVPQKAFLFASTIKENLKMDQELSDDEIWHFLELAGVKADVEKFPYKLETSLGEWGINLSGGQKQRVTLARALARRPKLLFLDDCLSAVDTVTEEYILNNLNRELKETTLVWVAHRESTLKYCDRIIKLNHGEEESIS